MKKIFASEYLKKLSVLTKEDLISIKGVGPVLADNFMDFLQSERYSYLLERFELLEQQNKGLLIETKERVAEQEVANLPLTGQKICITGSFEVSREIIKDRLVALGAKVVDQVSRQTTILLCGEEAGSKLVKAQSMGIRVVNSLDELINH
jgi:DNA ligase (NAD+)